VVCCSRNETSAFLFSHRRMPRTYSAAGVVERL
jgi:hypothetical protein